MDQRQENESSDGKKSNVIAGIVLLGFFVGLVYIMIYASTAVAFVIAVVFGILALFLFKNSKF